MQQNRDVFLPMLMAGMVLLPSINVLINAGVFLFFLSVVSLIINRKMLKLQFQNKIFIIIICLISATGLILNLTGISSVQQYGYEQFLVIISMLLLFISLKDQIKWERWYLDVLLYAGGFVLVLYFVNVAVAHGMIPLWDNGTDDIYYINMIALLVILIAAGQYIYCKEQTMQTVYVVSAVLASLVLAVNAAWGTELLAFVLLAVYLIAVIPVAAVIKKLIQIFFCIAFFSCNTSLFANYTHLIYVEGLIYNKECNIVIDLILCLLALYVFKQWDKIPEGAELTKVRLSRLQRACFYLLKYGGFVLIILAVLSRVNDKLGDSNIVQLFAEDKWEQLGTDVFVVTFLSLLENINQALMQAWHGNILAVMHQMYGVVGVIVIIAVLAVACYKLYLTIRDRRIKDSLLTWLAIGVLAAVICLPIMVEALPVYMMILLLALYTAKPENGELQVIETPRTEEREEAVEKEEMMEGVFII